MTRRHTAFTPLQVLERQHGFILQYEHNGNFQKYVRGCFSAAMAWSADDEKRQAQYVNAALNSFRHAEAYRVTEDMCELVVYAASQLDETDKIDRSMAPSPYGFVTFEKPLPIWDARGEKMLVHYLTWGSMEVLSQSILTKEIVREPGVWVTMWNDQFLQPDATILRFMESHPQIPLKEKKRMLQITGHYGFVGTNSMINGDSLGPMMAPLSEEARARMVATDKEMQEESGALLSDFPPPVGKHTNPARYVYALWMLLNQTIVKVEEESLSKAASKRVGRMPIPGRVSVVTLRRVAGRKSDGETLVEWQHRWLVRGHPAWRKCGPDRPGAVEYDKGWRVRVWIHPYTKGPEGKPFVQTEKVYNLSR